MREDARLFMLEVVSCGEVIGEDEMCDCCREHIEVVDKLADAEATNEGLRVSLSAMDLRAIAAEEKLAAAEAKLATAYADGYEAASVDYANGASEALEAAPNPHSVQSIVMAVAKEQG